MMAKIKLFTNNSYLSRFREFFHDETDAATARAVFRQQGGIRNFVRYVLAFIREQSDECEDIESDETLDAD